MKEDASNITETLTIRERSLERAAMPLKNDIDQPEKTSKIRCKRSQLIKSYAAKATKFEKKLRDNRSV